MAPEHEKSLLPPNPNSFIGEIITPHILFVNLLIAVAGYRSAIGRGMRAEKIRTYNYPQNRCTDHRVNQNYSLEKISRGELGELIADLRKLDRQKRLQAQ